MPSSDIFHFKQFDVQQDRCAMRVGTDGVLLGAWVPLPVSRPCRVLDVGAGTGVIALMLAQRLGEPCAGIGNGAPVFRIEAVEIDPEAGQQCHENFCHSPWAEHLTIHTTALQDFLPQPSDIDTPDLPDMGCYDLVVSNPPFYDATLKPTDAARATARHKDALPMSELMRFAQRWLRPGGRLALVYPMAYDSEVLTAATLSGLMPRCLVDVLTKEGKPCKRRMALLGRTGETQGTDFGNDDGAIQRQTLAIRLADGHYSPQYRALCASFYTHLTE